MKLDKCYEKIKDTLIEAHEILGYIIVFNEITKYVHKYFPEDSIQDITRMVIGRYTEDF